MPGRDVFDRHPRAPLQVALTTGLALMGVAYLLLYIDTMDRWMPLIPDRDRVQLWAGGDIYRQA